VEVSHEAAAAVLQKLVSYSASPGGTRQVETQYDVENYRAEKKKKNKVGLMPSWKVFEILTISAETYACFRYDFVFIPESFREIGLLPTAARKLSCASEHAVACTLTFQKAALKQ